MNETWSPPPATGFSLLVPTAFLAAAALIGAGTAACRPGSETDNERPRAGTLRVATTLPVLAFLAREVGGDDVTVFSLLPAGASPHSFEPSTGDMRRTSRADLFISAGSGLDTWAERLRNREHTDSHLRITDLAGLDLFADEHGHDPHVWLDPLRVRDVLTPALAHAFAELDPAHADGYLQRTRIFAETLTRLDADIRASLARAPNRGYVAFHNAWRYFAARYGLQELGVVEESAGEDPSPRDLAELARRAKTARTAAILIEPQLDPRTARTLASEFGGTTIVVDPLGDRRDSERSGYEQLMRFNARAFALALGAVNKESGKP